MRRPGRGEPRPRGGRSGTRAAARPVTRDGGCPRPRQPAGSGTRWVVRSGVSAAQAHVLCCAEAEVNARRPAGKSSHARSLAARPGRQQGHVGATRRGPCPVGRARGVVRSTVLTRRQGARERELPACLLPSPPSSHARTDALDHDRIRRESRGTERTVQWRVRTCASQSQCRLPSTARARARARDTRGTIPYHRPGVRCGVQVCMQGSHKYPICQ